MNKRIIFLLLPFFCTIFSYTLKAMQPGEGGARRGGLPPENHRGQIAGADISEEQRREESLRNESDPSRKVSTDFATSRSSDGLSPKGGFPVISVPSSAKSNPRVVKQNLENAKQAVKESLAHCHDASLGVFSDLKPYEDALKALESEQKEAVNDLSNNNSTSYQTHSDNIDQLLQALKTSCGIALSNEEVAKDESEDSNIALIPLRREVAARDEMATSRQLKECQKIRDKILSKVVPFDHRDPLHLAKWTVSDAVMFPLILPTAFPGMKTSDCVMAGLGANVVGTLTASPWLFDRAARAGSRLLPGGSYESRRQTFEKMSTFFRNNIADSDYLGYYLTGWAFLKIVNQDPNFLKLLISSSGEIGSLAREGTLLAGFIVPSALARKATSRFIQSKWCRNPLEEEAHILTSNNHERTASWEAWRGVIARFLPDIMAATTRSFLSNLYDHSQGKITLEEVFSKTAYSAGVYTGATIGFYTLYRLAEVMMWRVQPTRPHYQKFAAADSQSLTELKQTLTSFQSSSLQTSPNEVNRSVSSDNSSKDGLKLSPHELATLSHSLRFLNSPVTNFLGDPLYRMTSQHLEAFRALDAIKLLNRATLSLTSNDVTERKKASAALDTLCNYLMRNGDIETGRIRGTSILGNENAAPNNERNSLLLKSRVTAVDESKIDSLIRLFNTFSAQESLLDRAGEQRNYQAISNDEGENMETEYDDVF